MVIPDPRIVSTNKRPMCVARRITHHDGICMWNELSPQQRVENTNLHFQNSENIHSWISLIGDLVFGHQQGIYGFKFPKRFLEISSRDLTLLSILII
jgi:hypothetical protein